MCKIAFKSLTAAESAKRLLTSRGIACEVVAIDPALTKRGCSNGVSLPSPSCKRALEILDDKRIQHGDVIR